MADVLTSKLGTKVSPHHIGGVVGDMMNQILRIEPSAPPINALVVRAGTRLPGYGADSYIKKYLKKGSYPQLNDKQKRAALIPVHDAIFEYEYWPSVANSSKAKRKT